MLAARELGIDVPGELSVIGIDNHALAETFGLTTIGQDAVGQGRLAAQLMLEELAGAEPRPGPLRFPATLIERASTAPPGS
jgi:DNA-binding LacI/PurR family transcriptional regulator